MGMGGDATDTAGGKETISLHVVQQFQGLLRLSGLLACADSRRIDYCIQSNSASSNILGKDGHSVGQGLGITQLSGPTSLPRLT